MLFSRSTASGAVRAASLLRQRARRPTQPHHTCMPKTAPLLYPPNLQSVCPQRGQIGNKPRRERAQPGFPKARSSTQGSNLLEHLPPSDDKGAGGRGQGRGQPRAAASRASASCAHPHACAPASGRCCPAEAHQPEAAPARAPAVAAGSSRRRARCAASAAAPSTRASRCKQVGSGNACS